MRRHDDDTGGSLPKLYDIFNGEVANVTTYGAFVKIPGCRKQGLVHKSQMSSARIEDPNEMLAKGEKIFCKVIGMEEDGEKISLSMKVVNQTTGQDLDVNNVQASQDDKKRRQWKIKGDNKIELGAELNTTCPKCGGHGHFAIDCFVGKGNAQYDLIPDIETLTELPPLEERDLTITKKKKKEKKKKEKKKKKRRHNSTSSEETDEEEKKERRLKKKKSHKHSSKPVKYSSSSESDSKLRKNITNKKQRSTHSSFSDSDDDSHTQIRKKQKRLSKNTRTSSASESDSFHKKSKDRLKKTSKRKSRSSSPNNTRGRDGQRKRKVSSYSSDENGEKYEKYSRKVSKSPEFRHKDRSRTEQDLGLDYKHNKERGRTIYRETSSYNKQTDRHRTRQDSDSDSECDTRRSAKNSKKPNRDYRKHEDSDSEQDTYVRKRSQKTLCRRSRSPNRKSRSPRKKSRSPMRQERLDNKYGSDFEQSSHKPRRPR